LEGGRGRLVGRPTWWKGGIHLKLFNLARAPCRARLRLRRQIVLVFRGTNSNSDWLTDLRCANVSVQELSSPASPGAPGVPVHAGIWAAALLADQVSSDWVEGFGVWV
jgi:hypothetical protein